MPILNIAGYQFAPLDTLETLRHHFLTTCQARALKGTILLSEEGININLAGEYEAVAAFKNDLNQDMRFSAISFHETYSKKIPFNQLKVKIKKEIITLRQPNVNVVSQRAPSISPQAFKQWLDDEREMIVLDTRNDYEIRFGTFTKAQHLELNHFTEFANALEKIERQKPVVMFCTGGIRCEKAALYMMDQGFSEVYQLEGGILNYFAKVGGMHYQGECFVFDERVSVDVHLQETHTQQCHHCQGPLTQPHHCLNAMQE